jgi:hypothetical protein
MRNLVQKIDFYKQYIHRLSTAEKKELRLYYKTRPYVNQRAYFITGKIRHVAVIKGKGEGNISRPSVDERVNNLGWIVGENFHGILHRSCQSPALATGKHVPRYAPASSSAVTTSATGRCRGG